MGKNNAYLYGKNSVLERLKANPGSIKNVFVEENFSGHQVLYMLKEKHIPYRVVSERDLLRIKRADRLQGIVAEVAKFNYHSFDELLNANDPVRPHLLFLDEVNDPHNLGSIIRIAACFGGFAIIIPRHSSCEVNDTVMHVASGGENYTPVAAVSNTLNAVIKAKNAGYWIGAGVTEGGCAMHSSEIPCPFGLILGSEGKGVKQAVLKNVDLRFTLNMQGEALSLNVAMACAVFCYEISKQTSSSQKAKT